MTTAEQLEALALRPHHVVLTVGDHDANGFVHLAQWRNMSRDEAQSFIDEIDASVSDEQEPDIATASFTFILDLWDEDEMLDTGKRNLPTQTAMSLAPDQVQAWLNERPDPDSVIYRPIPSLPLRARAAAIRGM